MPHRRRETLQAVRDALARVQRISHVRARGANPYPEEGGVMLRLATNLKPTPTGPVARNTLAPLVKEWYNTGAIKGNYVREQQNA